MKDKFLAWWAGLQQRERWILAAGAVVVVATTVFLIVDPLFSGVAEREARVAEKEAVLAWMQRSAASLPRATDSTGQPPPTTPVLVVNRTVQSAGLGNYLKQAQPSGQDERTVRAQFEGVPFDRLLQWLAQIGTEHNLRIESAQFEPSGRPGAIDARISLQRGGA